MKRKNATIASIALGLAALTTFGLLLFGQNGQQRRMKLKRKGKQVVNKVREKLADGENI